MRETSSDPIQWLKIYVDLEMPTIRPHFLCQTQKIVISSLWIGLEKKSYVRFNVKICLHSKCSVVEVTSQLCLSIEPKIIPYVGSLTFGSLTSHFWTPSYTDHFDDHITPHTFKRRNGEILEYGYLAKSLATLNYFSKAHRQMAWKCLRWETESEEWLQGVQA